jgi:hypothetical protein
MTYILVTKSQNTKDNDREVFAIILPYASVWEVFGLSESAH